MKRKFPDAGNRSCVGMTPARMRGGFHRFFGIIKLFA